MLSPLDKTKRVITFIYLMLLLLLPVFMTNGLYQLALAKKNYYYAVTISYIVITVLCNMFNDLFDKRKKITVSKDVKLVYIMLAAYFGALLLSLLFSRYKHIAVFGSDGWYMGVLTQGLIIIAAVFISFYCDWKKFILYGLICAGLILNIACIVTRFHINFLHLYDGLSLKLWATYLPFIGQKNWYACFMAICFPVLMGGFLLCKKETTRIFLSVSLIVYMWGMVLQDSDSIYVSLLSVLLFIFIFYCKNLNTVERFFRMVTILLFGVLLLGFFQNNYNANIVPISPLAKGLGRSAFVYVLYVLCFLIWYAAYIAEHVVKEDKKEKIGSIINVVKKIVVCVAVITIVGTILCIVLNTALGDKFFLHNILVDKYFTWSDEWGTNRGMNWTYAVKSFWHMNIVRKFVGVGPDCYYSYALVTDPHFAATYNMIDNAHNEVLTTLINTGILGLISYFGIFATSIRLGLKKQKAEPVYLFLVAAIIGFLTNNMFSFMTVVSTPWVFVFVGMIVAEKASVQLGNTKRKKKKR